MPELAEGVPEMAEDVQQLAPKALEGVAMDEEAGAVPVMAEGVPEMAEGVPQLAPKVLEGVAVDDDTAVVQELPEGVPEKAEKNVVELLQEGVPAMVAVAYMPEVAEVVVPELEEEDEDLTGSEATGLEVCNKRKTRNNTMK